MILAEQQNTPELIGVTVNWRPAHMHALLSGPAPTTPNLNMNLQRLGLSQASDRLAIEGEPDYLPGSCE